MTRVFLLFVVFIIDGIMKAYSKEEKNSSMKFLEEYDYDSNLTPIDFDMYVMAIQWGSKTLIL